MSFRSASDSSTLLRSGPVITRSMASSSAAMWICLPLLRAVSSAASLITLARSAPVKPGVRRAMMSRSASGAIGFPRACTLRMPLRAGRSGWAPTNCPADRVDLVHEHDRRGVRLRLLEQVADTGGADADEHLHEVRAGDRVERHPGL